MIFYQIVYLFFILELEKPVAGPMATSCAALKQLGHTKSAFFTVTANNNKLNTVYCDFAKDDQSMKQILINLKVVLNWLSAAMFKLTIEISIRNPTRDFIIASLLSERSEDSLMRSKLLAPGGGVRSFNQRRLSVCLSVPAPKIFAQ